MTMDDVREYEKNMHEQTNIKVCNQHSSTVDDIESQAQTSVCRIFKTCCPPFTEHTHKLIFEKTSNASVLKLPQKSVITQRLLVKNLSWVLIGQCYLLLPDISIL